MSLDLSSFDKQYTEMDNILLKSLRAAVAVFRQTSPFHHALHIHVVLHQNDKGRFMIELHAYNTKINPKQCRLRPRKDGTETAHVEILERFGKTKRWAPVKTILTKYFKPENATVSIDTLRNWWDTNGKTFNWRGLPTELKEHVLQYCIWQPHNPGNAVIHVLERRRLPYEIFDIFGSWRSLLSVSKQVRILSLRLVLNGNIHCSGGFGQFCNTHGQFQFMIKRLSKYYQMVKVDSVPKNARMKREAHRYLRFPKLYPELDQFATFSHGIRKLSLGFRVLECFYFFKVTVGGIDKFRPPRYMTCDIFEQLPNLNGLFIQLPYDWREFMVDGPFPIYDEYYPCPRTLVRWIYERVAEVVAPYKKVNVKPFVDDDEEDNFWDMREACQLSWKITKQDMDELYEDCHGGISLDDYLDEVGEIIPSSSVLEDNTVLSSFIPASGARAEYAEAEDEETDVILPPRCKCEVPCREAFAAMSNPFQRLKTGFAGSPDGPLV